MIKRIMAVGVLGASVLGMMTANATTNGVYLTGQLGFVKSNSQPPVTTNEKPKDPYKNKYEGAERLAIGYQFNPNWAMEMGFLHLGNKQLNYGLEYRPTKDSFTVTSGSSNISQTAIDLAGKGIYPINDKFNVYGKLGVAYITTAYHCKTDTGSDTNVAKHKWAPEAAVGMSYDITPNMFVDASWTHIQPLGKNKPGNIDFAALGLGYSFG